MATSIPDKRTDGNRLHGEPEDSTELEEVLHWRNTYKELALGFADIAGAETGTRRRGRDLQVRRLQDRLAFWEGRRRELLDRLGRL